MQRSGRSGRHVDCAHARVINVEKPVETHVNAKRHVDEVFVLLLQAVVDGCQAVDDVGDGQQLAVVGELVLLERVLSHAEVQQVHCRGRMEGKGRKGERRRKVNEKKKKRGTEKTIVSELLSCLCRIFKTHRGRVQSCLFTDAKYAERNFKTDRNGDRRGEHARFFQMNYLEHSEHTVCNLKAKVRTK